MGGFHGITRGDGCPRLLWLQYGFPSFGILRQRPQLVQFSRPTRILIGILAAIAAPCTIASTPTASPVVLSISPGGGIRVASGKTQIAHITPGLFDVGWQGAAYIAGSPKDYRPGTYRGKLNARSGVVQSELRTADIPQGISLAYSLTPNAAMPLHIVHVTIEFPEQELVGQSYQCDDTRGTFPAKPGATQVFSKRIRRLSLATQTGGQFRIEFPAPINVLLQDNRRWGPTFSVRIGESCDPKKPHRTQRPDQHRLLLHSSRRPEGRLRWPRHSCRRTRLDPPRLQSRH